MTIVIVPKDSCMQKLELKEVITWYHSHGHYVFVFDNLVVRSYPDINLWYVEITKNG